uniref:DNA transposase THAP9 C-terminal domain-containing protein n=4 Tax=Photinus pyralis TaxID=7054 RepID=A0A1Y1KUR7_PHOPY
MYSFRRILLFTKVSPRGGNCKVLDTTTILHVPSKSKSRKTLEMYDVSLAMKYGLTDEVVIQDHEYYFDIPFADLNDITTNIITYIGGYVVKMLEKQFKCPECLEECLVKANQLSGVNYMLLLRKKRGALHTPSSSVVKICCTTEIYIKRMMIMTDGALPPETGFFDTFMVAVAQKTYEYNLFEELDHHFSCFAFSEENHKFLLIKLIIKNYLKIRIFSLGRRYTQKMSGPLVRQQLTKLILFNHQ